ncbi:TPA: hypothetical protein N6L98_004202, partial [Escherichia coli]|nr:hypothetical protein [Escherichia coli]
HRALSEHKTLSISWSHYPDYQARYYLLLLEKEGVVQRSPLRRGMATYWLLKGEKQAGQNCSSTT